MKTALSLIPFILAGFSLGCGGSAPVSPITVGHVAALSGPNDRPGRSAAHGIGLGLDEVNKDDRRTILVRDGDTEGKLAAFESQAVRLVSLNRAMALLGGTTAEEVQRMDRALPAPVGDQPSFLPIVSPCGRRTSAMSSQVILTGMSPPAQGKKLARYAVEELNVTRVSLVRCEDNESNQPLTDTFVREFAELLKKKHPLDPAANPVVYSYAGPLAKSDVLQRLKKEEPKALLLAGPKDDLRAIAEFIGKHLDEPLPIVLYAGDDGSLAPSDWGNLMGGSTIKVYFASAFALEKGNKELEDFAQNFRAKFNEDPDVFASLAYENIRLLGGALQRTHDSAGLRDDLLKTKDFAGLAGPLSIDNLQMQRSLFILRFEPAGATPLKKYAP